MNEQFEMAATHGERFYLSRLNVEDRAVYNDAPADSDLTGDIRLLRTLIARLAENGELEKREAAIRQAIGILYRLVQVQTHITGDENDLETEMRSLSAAFLAEDRGEIDGVE